MNNEQRPKMDIPLRVLIAEDSEDDTLLLVRAPRLEAELAQELEEIGA